MTSALNKLSVRISSAVIMKKILILHPLLIFSLVFGIGVGTDFPNLLRHFFSPPVSIHQITITEIPPIDVVWAMIGQVDQGNALTDLRKLTGEEMICLEQACYTITNRKTGSEGLQWAKDYIYSELVNLGYSVDVQDWSRAGYADQNFIVKKPGIISPTKEIYFVAHMDGVDTPAADDDASGVVTLLQLARVIRHRLLNYTVVLLFSTGEEQGAQGVYSYVDQLTPEQLSAINYVVNVDMVGYDANNDGVSELWNGEQPLDFVQLLASIISAYQIDLTPQIVSDCG